MSRTPPNRNHKYTTLPWRDPIYPQHMMVSSVTHVSPFRRFCGEKKRVISIADNQTNKSTNADENNAFSVSVKSDMRDKNSTKSPNKYERSRIEFSE